MDYLLLLNNVVRQPVGGSLSVSATVNGRDTLTADFLSPDGSYRPALDDEGVAIEQSGATSPTSLAIGTGAKVLTIQSGIALVDGERVRLYSAGTPTGWMEGKITSYVGTTLTVQSDTTSGTGTYADWIVGRRRFGGVALKTSEKGFPDASTPGITTRVEFTDFNQYADRRVLNLEIPTGTLKAALQLLVPYLTPYGITLDPDQVDGPTIQVFPLSFTTLLEALKALTERSGYLWEITYHKHLRMVDPVTEVAPFNINQGDGNIWGDITVEPSRQDYVNRVLVLYAQGTQLVGADDEPEQAAHGLWEIILRAPEITAEASAQELADTYLAAHLPVPKVVRYPTRRSGLRAGQSQTITVAWRNLNNTFLIREIVTTEPEFNTLEHAITAIEGSAQGADWRKVYEGWSGGGGVAGGGGGGGGGSTAGRRVYFLGGSMLEYVQSPAPDWVPASAVQVTIDTVAIGSTSVTVTVRLRATAGSVTARLRNVSDSTTAGTSAPVSSTEWQMVTFSATLTAGSKIYALEVSASLPDTDVAAVGFVE